MQKKINKQAALKLMRETDGKIFSASYIKKNGDTREITCRIGVTKHIKEVGLSFDANEKGLFNVFDMQERGYRFINLNTLKTLKINGESYEVEV